MFFKDCYCLFSFSKGGRGKIYKSCRTSSEMEKFELMTPVLFMVFNRSELTIKVFKEIKKAKPKILFVASDGPRTRKEGEKIKKIRDYILKNVDWECDVETLFRKKNLGCRAACSGAIDWFFHNVEQGIILEDDCLPDQNFFRFCQEMLERYKNYDKIVSVNGYISKTFASENSYDFSKKISLWGWASWRRAWEGIYRKEERYMRTVDSGEYIKEVFPNFFERILFRKRFFDSIVGRVSTWEFPWVFGIIRKKYLNIIPKVNLIENIGIDEEYTNTRPNFIDKKFLEIKRSRLKFPLKHPLSIKPNKSLYRRTILRDLLRIILKKIFFI